MTLPDRVIADSVEAPAQMDGTDLVSGAGSHGDITVAVDVATANTLKVNEE